MNNILSRTDVGDILRSVPVRLAPREVQLVRALCVPDQKCMKEIAYDLGLAHGTVKVYLSAIYHKLGWVGGSHRMLVLWAIAHREELSVQLPTPTTLETGHLDVCGEQGSLPFLEAA